MTCIYAKSESMSCLCGMNVRPHGLLFVNRKLFGIGFRIQFNPIASGLCCATYHILVGINKK